MEDSTRKPRTFETSTNEDRVALMRQTIDHAFANGIAITLPKAHRKGHHEKGWPHKPITDWDAIEANGNLEDYNVAVAFVEASNNFVELDVDSELARKTMAYANIPETSMVWGRPGNPASHYGFRTSNRLKLIRYKHGSDHKDLRNVVLLEVRAGDHYTLGPGSIHDESHEIYQWDQCGAPADVDADEFSKEVNFWGAMAMIASVWPGEGGRNEVAGHLAGGLARGGMPRAVAERFMRGVCAGADDEEVAKRVAYLHQTYDKFERGENVTGKKSLAEELGKRVVRQAFMALGLTVSSRPPSMNDLADSDYGNGWLLIQRHGDKLMVVPSPGANQKEVWLNWDESRWAPDRLARVNELMVDAIQAFAQESMATKSVTEQQQDLRRAQMALNRGRSQAAIWSAGHQYDDLKVGADELDPDAYLFNVPNGTVELATGDVYPNNPLDLITKCAGAPYVQDAPFSRSAQFLLDIMNGDEEMVAYLQRLVGSAMWGAQIDHVLPIFYGRGRNGKDTLFSVLQALFGDYAVKVPITLLMTSYDAGRASPEVVKLRGVRLAYAAETEKDQKLAEAKVKDFTGGGMLSARKLHEDYQEWEQTHTIILATNNKPVIRGQDDAVWDRMALVPFNVRFTENPDPDKNERPIDQHIIDALLEELPGWLNWAIEGCLEWQRIGLAPPEPVRRATRQYQNEMDVFGHWLDDACDVAPDHEDTQAALWGNYRQWRDTNNEEGPKSLGEFKQALTDHGFTRDKKAGNKIYWFGLQLKTTTERKQRKEKSATSNDDDRIQGDGPVDPNTAFEDAFEVE